MNGERLSVKTDGSLRSLEIEVSDCRVVRVVRPVIYASGEIEEALNPSELFGLQEFLHLPPATQAMMKELVLWGNAKRVDGLGTFLLFKEIKHDPDKFGLLAEAIAEEFLQAEVNTVFTVQQSGVPTAEAVAKVCQRKSPEVKLVVASRTDVPPAPPYLEIGSYSRGQPVCYICFSPDTIQVLEEQASHFGEIIGGFADDILDTRAVLAGTERLVGLISKDLGIRSRIEALGTLVIKAYTGCLQVDPQSKVKIPTELIPCVEDLAPPSSGRKGAIKFSQLPEAVFFAN